MANWLDAATRYHEMGFNCIPINDIKEPLCKWTKWQTERQKMSDLDQIFKIDAYGIGLVTGFNNLEAIDVDVKNDPDGRVWDDLSAELNAHPYNLITAYATQRTPSGGAHLLYRCMTKPPGNNPRLARKNGRAIIETRGSGGYAAVWPTPGYTITNIENLISSLFDEERGGLMELCATYNEDMPEKRAEPRSLPHSQPDQEKPWISFNREHGREYVLGVLENHGWEVIREKGVRTFLRRPGKDVGISADYHSEHNLFKVFTTSTEFSPDTAYTPFAVTVMLEYGGDYGAALRGLGLGERAAGQGAPAMGRQQEQEPADKWKDVFIYNPYQDDGQEEDWLVNFDSGNQVYGALTSAQILSLGGLEKSRKSRFMYNLIAGGLTGKPLLGFQWTRPVRKIFVFDTEQPDMWIKAAGRQMTSLYGSKEWADRLTFFGLRKYSDTQRLDFLENQMYLYGSEVDMIVVDGIADLCDDFNDLKKSMAVIHRLQKIQGQAVLAGVIHLNKGKDNAFEQGHLGSKFTKKADAVWRVAFDEDSGVSTLRCHRARGLRFPDVEFTQNRDGIVIPARSLVMPSQYDDI